MRGTCPIYQSVSLWSVVVLWSFNLLTTLIWLAIYWKTVECQSLSFLPNKTKEIHVEPIVDRRRHDWILKTFMYLYICHPASSICLKKSSSVRYFLLSCSSAKFSGYLIRNLLGNERTFLAIKSMNDFPNNKIIVNVTRP